MKELAIKKNVTGNMNTVIEQLIEAIKPAGFGILTRIDFDKKIKEKLNKDMRPTVILGACNPGLAYDAYQQATDVALLIPCNIVVTEKENGEVLIEAMRPSAMMQFLPEIKANEKMIEAEKKLELAINSL
ncbi:MAG: DUF302 domain-containing protein [Bdellovibrionaceae bacterium]|nr:DUF302 domain-containing protein [Pseudobdellovibrionaceae bacterium]